MRNAILAIAIMLTMVLGANFANATTCAINAGPIWNQSDANTKCPTTCSNNKGTWDGQWWTTVQGQMSVCECKMNPYTINAGPIWNQQDANSKCPTTCGNNNATWDGQWWTTVQGQMSVCECVSNCPKN